VASTRSQRGIAINSVAQQNENFNLFEWHICCKLSTESAGEKAVKIWQYLAKICMHNDQVWSFFVDTVYYSLYRPTLVLVPVPLRTRRRCDVVCIAHCRQSAAVSTVTETVADTDSVVVMTGAATGHETLDHVLPVRAIEERHCTILGIQCAALFQRSNPRPTAFVNF